MYTKTSWIFDIHPMKKKGQNASSDVLSFADVDIPEVGCSNKSGKDSCTKPKKKDLEIFTRDFEMLDF